MDMETILALSHDFSQIQDQSVKAAVLQTPTEEFIFHCGQTALALLALVNISANEEARGLLFHLLQRQNLTQRFIDVLVEKLYLTSAECSNVPSETVASVLSNLCLDADVWRPIVRDNVQLARLITSILTLRQQYNMTRVQLLLHLSSDRAVRLFLCCNGLPVLLHFINPNVLQNSPTCRKYASKILYNCTFDSHCFPLLTANESLVVGIMRSFCGPEDQLNETQRATLPESIRQLPGAQSTVRETVTEVLIDLMEILITLTSHPTIRRSMRTIGVDIVLQQFMLHVPSACAILRMHTLRLLSSMAFSLPVYPIAMLPHRKFLPPFKALQLMQFAKTAAEASAATARKKMSQKKMRSIVQRSSQRRKAQQKRQRGIGLLCSPFNRAASFKVPGLRVKTKRRRSVCCPPTVTSLSTTSTKSHDEQEERRTDNGTAQPVEEIVVPSPEDSVPSPLTKWFTPPLVITQLPSEAVNRPQISPPQSSPPLVITVDDDDEEAVNDVHEVNALCLTISETVEEVTPLLPTPQECNEECLVEMLLESVIEKMKEPQWTAETIDNRQTLVVRELHQSVTTTVHISVPETVKQALLPPPLEPVVSVLPKNPLLHTYFETSTTSAATPALNESVSVAISRSSVGTTSYGPFMDFSSANTKKRPMAVIRPVSPKVQAVFDLDGTPPQQHLPPTPLTPLYQQPSFTMTPLTPQHQVQSTVSTPITQQEPDEKRRKMCPATNGTQDGEQSTVSSTLEAVKPVLLEYFPSALKSSIATSDFTFLQPRMAPLAASRHDQANTPNFSASLPRYNGENAGSTASNHHRHLSPMMYSPGLPIRKPVVWPQRRLFPEETIVISSDDEEEESNGSFFSTQGSSFDMYPPSTSESGASSFLFQTKKRK